MREGEMVAISSTGIDSTCQIDPRFGRCEYFALADDDGNFEFVTNTARLLGNGAGIQAAQQMLDRKVSAVVTGDIGPNAFKVLSAAGVRVYVGARGSLAEVISAYRAGNLTLAERSTSPGRHGFGGQGRGQGRWGQQR
jgi:predicted Fe-Mo cluster-binding NifX family protein